MKTCFVIMPISDVEPYPSGHFKLVYEYIIKPACEKAGFTPIRADDVNNTNYIVIDVIKRIINSDIAICDLSSRNPNVFYELGIRQAFNLPTTLIRDSRTLRAFDIQGFRDIEYDYTLRVDNVESSIDSIAENLINTYESRNIEINSIISLLGISAAKTSSTEISKDTEIILSNLSGLNSRLFELEQKLNYSNSTLLPLVNEPEYLTPSQVRDLKVGDVVDHIRFGRGKIIEITKMEKSDILDTEFASHGRKKILGSYAKLKKV